ADEIMRRDTRFDLVIEGLENGYGVWADTESPGAERPRGVVEGGSKHGGQGRDLGALDILGVVALKHTRHLGLVRARFGIHAVQVGPELGPAALGAQGLEAGVVAKYFRGDQVRWLCAMMREQRRQPAPDSLRDPGETQGHLRFPARALVALAVNGDTGNDG